MPTIKSVLKLQFRQQVSPLVQTTVLQVDSLEEFTLSVGGVPHPSATKIQTKSKTAAAKRPLKRMNRVTYKPNLSNVKFLAIYNNGQGSGVRVKIGSSKMEALTEPLIFMNSTVAAFGPQTSIVLENDSVSPKSVTMLVGSDLPKDARQLEVVEIKPAKQTIPAKRKKSVKSSKVSK